MFYDHLNALNDVLKPDKICTLLTSNEKLLNTEYSTIYYPGVFLIKLNITDKNVVFISLKRKTTIDFKTVNIKIFIT